MNVLSSAPVISIFALTLAACAGSSTTTTSPCGAPCANRDVTWTRLGGFVPTTAVSTVNACDHYSQVREGATSKRSCTQPLECAGGKLGSADVARALEHPDVAAAVAKAPVLYGVDARATDGQILKVTIGTAEVSVGYACHGASGCVDAPPGVQALAKVLDDLQIQESSRGTCATVLANP